MDKTLVIDDKNNGSPVVHILNYRKSQIHEEFGLWMNLLVRGNRSTEGVGNELDMMNPPRKLRIFKFYAISHMYEGTGFHYSQTTGLRRITPGDCIITTPDTIQLYGACKNADNLPYVEDNICFAGPLADHFFRSGVIKDSIIKIGTERKLLPIIDKALDPSRDSQIAANIMLINFLTSIYIESRKTPSSDINVKLKLLTEQMIQDPSHWWTVEEMADFCGVCCSYFRAAFHQYAGLSPKLYADKIKIGIATEKLIKTDLKIQELAHLLGYVDQYHFSRRFKQIVGLSPLQYRTNSLLQYPDAKQQFKL